MDTESPGKFFHGKHASTSTTQPSITARCSVCSHSNSKSARNIVVCIDGTSNRFGQNNTNVVKLLSDIDLETASPQQLAYYSRGIGTGPKKLRGLDRLERAISDTFDMAIAWNVEEIIKEAYGWLARTYQEGDQIYLFGFSRGAYQVRVLAGMIHDVGLLKTPTEKQIVEAYEHYEEIRSKKSRTEKFAREFKNTFCCYDSKFILVRDTVSSVGFKRSNISLSRSSSTSHACYFRHALALDERRVKFMPEYLQESHTYSYDHQYKHSSSDHDSITFKTANVKEVWFAGSHSDVGGSNIPGKLHQAGNVSFLWMRREAAAQGLVLRPTDIVWLPDDIDCGTSDSMSFSWRIFEYVPITHQTSFFGAGEYTQRSHWLQPRRIIPGQKVHASVLYSIVYQPHATLQQGAIVSVLESDPEDLNWDKEGSGWESGLFDETVARRLLAKLDDRREIEPIYLDRLLFLLRFDEGKKYIRNVPEWKSRFKNIIKSSNLKTSFVRLFALVAYYEAEDADSLPPPDNEFGKNVFEDANKCLRDILPDHQDGPRVITLLRPLLKHQILRERILTPEALDSLMRLLDNTLSGPRCNFGKAMDCLICLLQYEETQEIFIKKLKERDPVFRVSRLSRILQVDDTNLLIAALRMMLTFSRIPEVKAKVDIELWWAVKHRIGQLAEKDEGRVGLLAVEIWFLIFDANDRHKLNLRNPRIRANFADVFFNFDRDVHDSVAKQHVFREVFGFGADSLTEKNQKVIRALRKAVELGNSGERINATRTLLKLCETKIIRDYLCEIKLLELFINQLQYEHSALLAAFALVNCMEYEDMKNAISYNEFFPRHIISILQLDYFDDVICLTGGFYVFSLLMRHADLREKIKNYKISEVLAVKLGEGKPKDIRTVLICLDIFLSFEPGGLWVDDLVEKGLKNLRNRMWNIQRTGVIILSALAQTRHGVDVIRGRISEIIKMLVPEDNQPIEEGSPAMLTSPTTCLPTKKQTIASLVSWNKGQIQPDAMTTQSADSPKLSSWMMGLASALLILAHDHELGKGISETPEYIKLKHLHLSGKLVGEIDSSPWDIHAPNIIDITRTTDKLIKVIDERRFEAGFLSIEDAVVPHIEHWDRLVGPFLGGMLGAIVVPPVIIGISTVAILGTLLVAPIHLSGKAYASGRRLWSQYRCGRVLDSLRND